MRIEVYQDTRKEEEKVLRVRLFQDIDSVTLAAVDRDGDKVECGDILDISHEGIALRLCVSPDIGLPLDDDGRVKDITQ